jgi:hypothetical protein
MSSGSTSTTGPGPAVHCGGKCAGHVFRNALGSSMRSTRLAMPFGAGPEENAVVHLLERLAVALVAGHVTHKQHHRCGVLKCGVNTDGRIGGARPARHKTHARSAGQLAHGASAMKAAPPSCRLITNWIWSAWRVKAVQSGKIAFPRNAKDMGHALGHQAFDQKMASQDRRSIGHGIDFINVSVNY